MKTIIITGLSGAGKTQAIDCLEDLGYYCIDNMPPALIKSFIELTRSGHTIDNAAFVVDVRSRAFFDDFQSVLEELDRSEIDYKLLYLEASDRVLLRRYSETRRVHPLSAGGPVEAGLVQERELLTEIRAAADYIIDTSNIKVAEFWAQLRQLVTSEEDQSTFMINIMSFGFKNGTPPGMDIVFDTRFIPNPYYVQSLRKLTGNNQKVSRFVLKHEITQTFLQQVVSMVERLAPYYMKEGKYGLNIGIGCTGGHHRSVAVANEFHRRLREKGHHATIEHRDL
ncbi:MAG: RNase adapter RapZ [Firmicutes bacterium]|nr:RNase adapter RapZ [Bacillota bacterium]